MLHILFHILLSYHGLCTISSIQDIDIIKEKSNKLLTSASKDFIVLGYLTYFNDLVLYKWTI